MIVTFNESLLFMLLACQVQIETNTTRVFRHSLNDMPPQHAGFAKVRRVAEYVESTPRSRQSNADTVLDLQKSNVTANIASDKGEKDHFVLFALVRVYRYDVESSSLQLPVFTQLSQDQFSLSVIEGQYRDLLLQRAIEDIITE